MAGTKYLEITFLYNLEELKLSILDEMAFVLPMLSTRQMTAEIKLNILKTR